MLVVQRRNNQSKTSDKGAQIEKTIKVNRSHKLTTSLCRWNKNLKKSPPTEEQDATLRQFQQEPNTKWRMYLLRPIRSGCLQETKSPRTP